MDFQEHLLAEAARQHATRTWLTGAICQYGHAHVDRRAASACTGEFPGDWIYRQPPPAPRAYRRLQILTWAALLLIGLGSTLLVWWRAA